MNIVFTSIRTASFVATLTVAGVFCSLPAHEALAQATATATTATPAASAPVAEKPAPAASAPALTASQVAASGRSNVPLFKNDQYGIEVMGAHLSGSGYVIDVRYRVVDAAKAAPMLDRKVRPVLINEDSGDRFYVPQPPIVGALRQTARNNNVVPGKVYFMLFANPDKRIKPGQKLIMMVGDQKFGTLTIEK